jgi:hypothetical protein
MERIRARLRPLRRRGPVGGPAPPDPAKPPRNRGPWAEAALANVDITEVVKRQIRTNTRPWEK